jgi:hypothetical protein
MRYVQALDLTAARMQNHMDRAKVIWERHHARPTDKKQYLHTQHSLMYMCDLHLRTSGTPRPGAAAHDAATVYTS